jgi:3'-phosphoadenosine 5'-phosphosulfate sulfotransferase (PAPS reductase)/FAD synthetase
MNKVTVVWVNPGDPYKETVKYMEQIKNSVPNFVMLQGNQRNFVKQCGYPADLVPFAGTPVGRLATTNVIKIVSIAECCGSNLWAPMHQFVEKFKPDGIIRGEKYLDKHKSRVGEMSRHFDADVYNPLYYWTDDDVVKFLGADIPESYKRGLKSSLDCRTCTAYSSSNPGRHKDLITTEPDAAAEIEPVVQFLTQQAKDAFEQLRGM